MDTPSPQTVKLRLLRLFLAGLSVLCFALGWVGIWVPGLPTTIFWIASAYLAAKSCPVIQRWIYARGRVGGSVRMIVEERAMTAAGKRRALAGMVVGIGISLAVLLGLGSTSTWLVLLIAGAGVAGVGTVLFGIRTHPPTQSSTNP